MPILKASELQEDSNTAVLIIGGQGAGKSYQAQARLKDCERVLWVGLRNLDGLNAYPNWDILLPATYAEFKSEAVVNAKNYDGICIDDFSGLKDLALPEQDVTQKMWGEMGRTIQTDLRLISNRVPLLVGTCVTIQTDTGRETMALNPDLERRIGGFFSEVMYVTARPKREKGKVTGIERLIETDKMAALNYTIIEA